MIKTNEVVLKVNNEWLHFAEPKQIITARTLEGVLPALLEMERLVNVNAWHAAGFLSYEAASAFDPVLRTKASVHPERRTDRSSRSSQSKNGFANNPALRLPSPVGSFRSHRLDAFSGAREEFPFLWFGLYPGPRAITLPESELPKEILNWEPTTDRESYNRSIDHIREHIAEGRTYQVNYTMRLQTNYTGDAWDFFLHLAQSQNNHAAYIDLGRYAICSASPELFFQLDGDTIICRPMKGTVKRGRTTIEDTRQARWLQDSEKNRAENVMIVDMVRNDLGRFAKIGSVNVPALFNTERYPTLWQMTSAVTAKTSASMTEIFKALFPSASITGAPKIGTMKIISELESTPRRIYTGSIGYISPRRKAKFNVAIRTALIDRQAHTAEYGVGGGIVWDSTSTDEYAEALLKARVLTEQPVKFSLLETMLWTPDEGFFLREKHIERMLDSADYFDFQLRGSTSFERFSSDLHLHRTAFPGNAHRGRRGAVRVSRPPILREIIETYLDKISSQFTSPQRVRLLLGKAGNLNFEAKSFQLSENHQPLKARLAKQPIDSDNVFLFHKTTKRDFYNFALSSAEQTPQEHGYDDVLLYNASGELTEFTIGNLVVELDGKYFTPPLSCGLLAGTFRAHLLETGQVAERTIRVEELSHYTKIFMVNSVRKWQRVEMK